MIIENFTIRIERVVAAVDQRVVLAVCRALKR